MSDEPETYRLRRTKIACPDCGRDLHKIDPEPSGWPFYCAAEQKLTNTEPEREHARAEFEEKLKSASAYAHDEPKPIGLVSSVSFPLTLEQVRG